MKENAVDEITARARGFSEFFDALYSGEASEDELVRLHAEAEQLAVNQGVAQADAARLDASTGESLIVQAADIWRIGATNRAFVRDVSSAGCLSVQPACSIRSWLAGGNLGGFIANSSFHQRNEALAYWAVTVAYYAGVNAEQTLRPPGLSWAP